MNTTTIRIARYAGAGISGIAVTCVLATPAIAMQPSDPDPAPVIGQQTNSRVAEHDAGTGTGTTPPPAAPVGEPTSGGVDWSTLAAGLGSGAMLTGFVVLGAAQLRRRQPHPA